MKIVLIKNKKMRSSAQNGEVVVHGIFESRDITAWKVKKWIIYSVGRAQISLGSEGNNEIICIYFNMFRSLGIEY